MSLPKIGRQWFVHSLSTNFRASTRLDEVAIKMPGKGEALVKNVAVGINASDVNFSAGAYDPSQKPPFVCGFEAVGTVIAAGEHSMFKEGDHVAYMNNGAFGEYQTIQVGFSVPDPNPEYIPLMVSGLTAALALENNGVDVFQKGGVKAPKTGLVTAAAGGTGQFAVQLMKTGGVENIFATCSTNEKVEFLKSIGATHPINVSEVNLGKVLRQNAKTGINIAYESVGGEVLDTTIDNLAVRGKCLQIGFVSSYDSGSLAGKSIVSPKAALIPVKLLQKSAAMQGFFLMSYVREMPEAFMNLVQLLQAGEITSKIDFGPNGGIKGIENIPDGVDYLYERKSIGKIIVQL